MQGIYTITHVASGRCYVGSAVNLRKRWNLHRANLNNGTHHNPHLQQAWKKYGVDAFTWEVIENVADKSALIQREQFYLDTLHPEFNHCKIAGSRLGSKQSPEAVTKTRAKLTGRKRHPEEIAKTSAACKGRTISEEQRAKISQSLTGQKFSNERKAAIAGRKLSEEHKAKLAAANRCRKCSEETKAKLALVGAASKGRKHTDEAKARISQGGKAAWEKRRAKSAPNFPFSTEGEADPT